jgi:hypothetical protein
MAATTEPNSVMLVMLGLGGLKPRVRKGEIPAAGSNAHIDVKVARVVSGRFCKSR